MHNVQIAVEGVNVDFETVRRMGELIALQENEYATLVAWNDRDGKRHSPQCLKCEIKGEPGWEVYGRNHAGRLRISINEDQFVLIYS